MKENSNKSKSNENDSLLRKIFKSPENRMIFYLLLIDAGMFTSMFTGSYTDTETNSDKVTPPNDAIVKSINMLKSGGHVKYMIGELSLEHMVYPNKDNGSVVVDNPAIVETNGSFIAYFTPLSADFNSESAKSMVLDGTVNFSKPLKMSRSEFNLLPEASLNNSGNLVGGNVQVGFVSPQNLYRNSSNK